MNWGKNKAFQTTNVPLNTWLLRFKKTKDSAEPKLGNAQRKWNNGRVHDGDDDGFYWTSPFDKEKYEDKAIISNSDYRHGESPVICGGFKKISDGRTMREFINEEGRLKEYESRNSKTGFTENKVVLENKREVIIQENSADSLKSSIVNGYVTDDLKLKSMKPVEIMLKNEKQRRRSKQGRIVNAHSPRTLTRSECRCRIKAFENMKRRRLKMKEMNTFSISLDCNAIVKSAFDPEMDFRESMMEMMIEKGVMERDKLEELLTCYLTLNCDVYHHLIVKVFKETYNQFVKLYL